MLFSVFFFPHKWIEICVISPENNWEAEEQVGDFCKGNSSLHFQKPFQGFFLCMRIVKRSAQTEQHGRGAETGKQVHRIEKES